MAYVIPLVVLFLFSGIPPVYSQPLLTTNNQQNRCDVWGQVTGSARLLQDGLNIEMVGRDKSQKKSIHLGPDGNFEFESVAPGTYKFRVFDRGGNLIHEQGETLAGKRDFVLLLLRDPGSVSLSRNTVSYTALQHKTPGKAWDAFRDAQKARDTGNTQKCIERLQQALAIDADFAEAHSDLAAIFSKLGRLDEALQHAEAAFTLNPSLPEAGCNLGLLLVSMKKYAEAELLARRLLNGPYPIPQTQAVLAISLIGQKKNIDEALRNLGLAAKEIPFMRLLAARALAETGRPELALIQVKTYLQSSAHDCEREALAAWADKVESKLAVAK